VLCGSLTGGVAYLFSVTTQHYQELRPTSAPAPLEFGYQVALGEKFAAVGLQVPSDPNTGFVVVYRLEGGSFVEYATLSIPTTVPFPGWGLGVAADQDTIVATSSGTDLMAHFFNIPAPGTD
jgi:hypothetical protein